MRIFSDYCVTLLRLYQLIIAPIFISLGVRCRFEPHCSEYASQSIQLHGPVLGFGLALTRLGRCHPFCKGGHDPVPKKIWNWRSQNG